MTIEEEKRFSAALANFLVKLTEREAAHSAANFPNMKPGRFVVSGNPIKYFRVVKENGYGGSSAYCFVERETGNIYKPAGWKAPTTKHVRGNIYAENPLAGTGIYGTDYLR